MNRQEIIERLGKEYDSLENLTGDTLKVSKNGLVGIFSISANNLILQVKYNHVGCIDNDKLFWVLKNNLLGIFSISEKLFIVPVEYNNINCLNKDKFRVQKDKLYGIFSISNKSLVVPIEYDDIEIKDDQIVLTKKTTLPLEFIKT